MQQLIDKYNRVINYLRISVTDRCNLKCFYCRAVGKFQLKKRGEILSYEELIEIIKEAVELGINKIRITGGEPLVRKNICYLIKEISKLDKITDLALTTNGSLLKYYAHELKEAGLKRINISLDSLDKKKFERITDGGKLTDVLEGIKEAKRLKFDNIKINVVLIRGVNDDEVFNFISFAKEYNLILRFIEYMPIWNDKDWNKKFISNDEIMNRIRVNGKQEVKNGGGIIGLISPISNKFCQECNKLRITADGYIIPCLSSRKEINIRDNKYNLKELFKKAADSKPKAGIFSKPLNRTMREIGG